MKNRESEEMYLETILLLSQAKSSLRSVDIVEELDYAKSSVSRAVNLLQRKGYIDIAQSGEISLSEAGRAKAAAVYERHRILTAALLYCGADRKLAENNACRIEHVLDDEMFALIKSAVEAREKNAR